MQNPYPYKICFVSSRTGFIVSHNLYIDYSNGSLIKCLSNQLDVHVAIFNDIRNQKNYTTCININKTYKLPFPFSQIAGIINSIKIYRNLSKARNENAVLIVQLPSIGIWSMLFIRGRVIYQVCANVITAARNPAKYKGFIKIFSVTYALIVHWVHEKLFKNPEARLIVHGNELGQLYNRFNPKIVISSSISKEDIVSVPNQNPNSELLFIGRPSLEKGFKILLDVYQEINIEGFIFSFVGLTEDEFLKLNKKILKGNIPKGFKFYDFKDWNNGLKKVLQNAYALIVPSLSEGTPRVILEAMSQGCPVIASNVGGIPTIIQHNENGLLFNPFKPAELVVQIRKLKYDAHLRSKLIDSAIKTAQDNTIDKFAAHFIELIKSYD